MTRIGDRPETASTQSNDRLTSAPEDREGGGELKRGTTPGQSVADGERTRPPQAPDTEVRVPTTQEGMATPASSWPQGLRLDGTMRSSAELKERQSTWAELGRCFSLDLAGSWSQRGLGPVVRGTIDVGRLRDIIAGTEWLKREERTLLTGVLDAGTVWFLWDVVGGTAEYFATKWTGGDTRWKGANRFVQAVSQDGLGAFGWKGVDIGDGNPGGVNTAHWVPYLLASSYMRARGYEPWQAAVGGIFANVVLHETLAECWEQPKSGHDLVMNSLGAIFGAFPELGVEYQVNLGSGMPRDFFYAKVNDDLKAGFTLEQIADWSTRSHEPTERPLMEYNIGAGVRYDAESWLSFTGNVSALSDTESKGVFKMNGVGFELGVSAHLP